MNNEYSIVLLKSQINVIVIIMYGIESWLVIPDSYIMS